MRWYFQMVCLILREEYEESSSKLGSKMAAKSNMAAKMADNTYPWILEQNPPKTPADPWQKFNRTRVHFGGEKFAGEGSVSSFTAFSRILDQKGNVFPIQFF